MLTYNLSTAKGPKYQTLYELIKKDITGGSLKAGDKLPSRRSFANNLGVSTVTVDNAYDQLLEEGYIYSLPKKGYFVEKLSRVAVPEKKAAGIAKNKVYTDSSTASSSSDYFDFSSGRPELSNFPFSVWAKVSRNVISEKSEELLKVSFSTGVLPLRQAIAGHLSSFRGMDVSPEQIVVGAGTEYLYGLIIKLLGKNRNYCLENPGYRKIRQVYDMEGIDYCFADLDEEGIRIRDLEDNNADVAHISPTHHFPTGITTPITRRYELLSWAGKGKDRYIIEDDYDSEFRLRGTPIPTLQSIDNSEKVIYMNTFSKSLTSTIRISYMVLPLHLAKRYFDEFSFLSCTVSTFDQYTLADFISKGYFEKHINRMRIKYSKKREQVLSTIQEIMGDQENGKYGIEENDSGLHFILKLNTGFSDKKLEEELFKKKMKISAVSDFYHGTQPENTGKFIFDYSNIDLAKLPASLKILKSVAF
ncbi:MocR-like pyridoxine biosynthesis transcription factor PdxR [Butyrivibrio sp. MC2021]|uniref:MocR-like pyridoxine biosynthesis transcription factor PdxR n=1 Tax=Butyrivibrio sp. MC2021 TaxID=1408306 RepID=UPI00047D42F0|nr:PLP-dependent aminotransferase family protein [Butyrivibrio sp. MC2021]